MIHNFLKKFENYFFWLTLACFTSSPRRKTTFPWISKCGEFSVNLWLSNETKIDFNCLFTSFVLIFYNQCDQKMNMKHPIIILSWSSCIIFFVLEALSWKLKSAPKIYKSCIAHCFKWVTSIPFNKPQVACQVTLTT